MTDFTLPEGKPIKKKAIRATKRKVAVKKVVEEEPEIVEGKLETLLTEEEMQNIVFKPNAGPQEEFLAASEREVLYGGSAGGRGIVLSLATFCW